MTSRVPTHSRYKEWISVLGYSRNDLSFSRQLSAPLTPSLLRTGPVHLPSLGFLPCPVRCLASPLTRGQSRCPLNSIFHPLMLLLSSCLFYLEREVKTSSSVMLPSFSYFIPLDILSLTGQNLKLKLNHSKAPTKERVLFQECIPKSTFFVNPTKLALVSN